MTLDSGISNYLNPAQQKIPSGVDNSACQGQSLFNAPLRTYHIIQRHVHVLFFFKKFPTFDSIHVHIFYMCYTFACNAIYFGLYCRVWKINIHKSRSRAIFCTISVIWKVIMEIEIFRFSYYCTTHLQTPYSAKALK